MEKEIAEKFWQRILDYADATGELLGEGNSGEFHDPKEYAEIKKDYECAERELTFIFKDITGYMPIYNDNLDEWELSI